MIFRKYLLPGKKHFVSALSLSVPLFLSACTSGSMRVDIEVYKGPLSKTKEIQTGELKGYIKDTITGLNNFKFSESCADSPHPQKYVFNFGSCENFFNNLTHLQYEFEKLDKIWSLFKGFSSPTKPLVELLQKINDDINEFESLSVSGNKKLKSLADELDKLELPADPKFSPSWKSNFKNTQKDFVKKYSEFKKEKDNFYSRLNEAGTKTINLNLIKDNFYILNILNLLSGDCVNRNKSFEKDYLECNSRIVANMISEMKDIADGDVITISNLAKNISLKSLLKSANEQITKLDKEVMNNLLEITAALASRLHSSSFYWSTYVNVRSLKKQDRFFITEYAVMASEHSNQISSRTDALQKQLVGDSRNGFRRLVNKEELPLSTYLRDTRPTDFTELYQWQNFSGKKELNLNKYSDNKIEMRINAFKHIFDDHFWSNINTVYASGGGDAHMAFVKDEIGNWTLKSFESDPTELVQAYKKLTLAAITAASKAAVASGTGGVSPDMLATIGKLMSGRTRQAIDPATQVKIDALKKQTIKDLEGLKSQTDSSATIIKGKQILKDYENKLKVLQGS